MKLLLGQPYLTRTHDHWVLTLPFYNGDARGEAYRYARLALHVDDTRDTIVSQLRMLAEKIEKEILPYEEA